MSSETERECTRPEVTALPAPDFYFPAGGGADPDFFLPADRDDAPGSISRWLHSHSFAGWRAH